MKVFGILMIFLMVCKAQAADKEISSKLILRSGYGMFENAGTQQGSSASVGGFNLQYIHFLNERLAFGFGYMAQFDLSDAGVPLSGMEIIGRAYFYRQSSRILEKQDWGSYEVQKPWSPYLVGIYGKRQFYLGGDLQSIDPTKSLSGEYSVINLGLGTDLGFSGRFEWNVEATTSVFSLASSDPRVKIKETVLWFGVNYLF